MKRLADPEWERVLRKDSTRSRRKAQPAMAYGASDLPATESEMRMVDADGSVLLERRIATPRDRLTAVSCSRGPMRVLLESGTGSEWWRSIWKDWDTR